MSRLLRLLLVPLGAALLAGCNDNGTSPDSVPPANVPYSQTDIRVGTGAEAVLGRTVTVHYSLWLYSESGTDNKGRLVETTAGGAPQPISLIVGRVIDGWVRGVPGMKVGGIRRLVLPPEFGYGAQGSPPQSPGNATLLFEIDLIAVQ
jgi:FKBP-type peptidyl-prolyl cis-trans isomerase